MTRILILLASLLLVGPFAQASTSAVSSASEVNALAQQIYLGTGIHLLENLDNTNNSLLDFLNGTVSREIVDKEYLNRSDDYSQASRKLDVQIAEFESVQSSPGFVRGHQLKLIRYLQEFAHKIGLIKKESDAVYRIATTGKNPELYFRIGSSLGAIRLIILDSENQLNRGLKLGVANKEHPIIYHIDALIQINEATIQLLESVTEYFSEKSSESSEQNLYRSYLRLEVARSSIKQGKENLPEFFDEQIDPFVNEEDRETLYENFLATYQIDLQLALTVDKFRMYLLRIFALPDSEYFSNSLAMQEEVDRYDVNRNLLLQDLVKLEQQRMAWSQKIGTL
jgi:hypothetical protein